MLRGCMHMVAMRHLRASWHTLRWVALHVLRVLVVLPIEETTMMLSRYVETP